MVLFLLAIALCCVSILRFTASNFPFRIAVKYKTMLKVTLTIHYHTLLDIMHNKKNVKIPKGKPGAVNQRTDNTISKRKVQKDKQRSTKHFTEN